MIIQSAVVQMKRHAHWQVPPESVTTRHQALVTRSPKHNREGASTQPAMNLEVLAERAVQERLAMEKGTRPTCCVCGDRASGRHYGVLTCDGCRGFFKRSVRRNPGYSCKFQGTCIVDLKRRNQCQACRFQRCLNVGMNRHAVQHERLSKRKAGSEASRQYLEETQVHNICSNTGRSAGEEKYEPVISYGVPSLQGITKEVTKENRPPLAQQKSLYSIDSLLEVTSRERSEVATVNPLTPPLTPPQSPLIPSLYREKVKASLESILQGSLSWAHSIPIFRDLSNQDKCILLREGWTELFLITLVEMEFSDTLLISFLREATEPHIMKKEESKIDRLAMALARLRSLNIDPVEMAYLKAVAIFKPCIEGLAMKHYVESMQDQAQVMLADYIRSRYPGDNVRFGRLILTLTLLKGLGLSSLDNCLDAQLMLDP